MEHTQPLAKRPFAAAYSNRVQYSAKFSRSTSAAGSSPSAAVHSPALILSEKGA